MYNNTAATRSAEPAGMDMPLTEAQREIWYASQMSAGASLAYLESTTLRLKGNLNLGALRRALRLLMGRHEALRIRIGAHGDVQHILEGGDIELTTSELPASTPAQDRELRAGQWLDAQLQQPFDLAGGPLFRSALL
ncbi:MAG: hypothetical protein RIQ93_2883, partial [Verrucomicrobiota bacterium]